MTTDARMDSRRLGSILQTVVAALVLLGPAPAASVLGAEPVPPLQAPPAPVSPAPGPNAFSSARPYLVALSVADVKASVVWYCEKLGFRIDRVIQIFQLLPRTAAAMDRFPLTLRAGPTR